MQLPNRPAGNARPLPPYLMEPTPQRAIWANFGSGARRFLCLRLQLRMTRVILDPGAISGCDVVGQIFKICLNHNPNKPFILRGRVCGTP